MKKRFIMLGLALVLAMSTPVMASENETAIIPETEDAETSIDNAEEIDIPEENTTSITDEEIVEVDDNTANETISVSETSEEAEEAIEAEEDLLEAGSSKKIVLSQTAITVEAGGSFELSVETGENTGVEWYVIDYYRRVGLYEEYATNDWDSFHYSVEDTGGYGGSDCYYRFQENGMKLSVKGNYCSGTYTIEACLDGYQSAQCIVNIIPPEATVRYRTHVQKIGWQPYVKDGELSGTTGKSLRLEAINIDVSGNPLIEEYELDYRVHVQTYGWQWWKYNNEMAGTSGEAKRLEAIRIELNSAYYDIYYQTHVQHFGWTGWACNGEECGSAGYSYRLEGIRIKIVRKGEPAPGDTSNRYYVNPGSWVAYDPPHPKISGASIGYTTHVQSYGWQSYVYDGAMSGTSGQSKRLEAIQIQTITGGTSTPPPAYGNIVYRTHVQSYGWQSWKQNGEASGTFGEAKRLEGIQIYMTGNLAKYYDIYYCVHAQTYGWLDWAKNGEMAGTSGLSKRLEGIKILLVEKGGPAPGATATPYVLGPGGSLPDNPYVEPI